MENGTAIAIGVGAVVLVFFLTKQQEQRTAAMIAQQQQQQAKASSGPYALSLWDQFTVGATILSTYYGGPSTGAKVAGALAQ